MSTIENPILRGFNPDPSIVRVGEDYYIATSTFEWFPGVQIHHSRDLKHWELIERPLDRVSQLDLKGVPDSCGVWAPCLSYSDGVFYLVFSNVQSFDGPWKDTPNYLVTANDIHGPWSEPIFLSASGFDGSLFHDDDGSKWYMSMVNDHRIDDGFGGIILQEYDSEAKQLVGDVHYLTAGTELGLTEGPHIYTKEGFYYLLLAEGGTEYGHAATIMRSESITGPYEAHPGNPIVTSRDNAALELQKAGHASIVQTQLDDWYIVFLVGRPLTQHGRCILGRETAIEALEWKDGWPVLKHGGHHPRLQIQSQLSTKNGVDTQTNRDEFEGKTLNKNFQSLRVPVESHWCSLEARKGFLRLRGRDSLTSKHSQSLIARRVQSYSIEATTCLEFDPIFFQQLAGLVFYYNTGHYHYLYVAGNDNGTGKQIGIISSDNFSVERQTDMIDASHHDRILLKGVLDGASLQFYYSLDEINFAPIGEMLDASILSDDYVRDGSERYRPAFTGCFVGMCCQDLASHSITADFDWFEYREI